ncbi:hypothetical protein OG623_00195 [Streptomyces sp. NBC_01012]|nr:hypothetical protein OG623_00195 [Streptomyces sp. NBC_01012]
MVEPGVVRTSDRRPDPVRGGQQTPPSDASAVWGASPEAWSGEA